jgi:hypothetical protein
LLLLKHLTLLTKVPILTETSAHQIYNDRTLRGRMEHGYRFDQEPALDVEDLRVHPIDRMRRVFALFLVAAQFVFILMKRWPSKAILRLSKLSGKLGLKSDRDGSYILLRAISAI